MITFKKTFDYYATDGELDVFVNNIFDAIIGDPEATLAIHRNYNWKKLVHSKF